MKNRSRSCFSIGESVEIRQNERWYQAKVITRNIKSSIDQIRIRLDGFNNLELDVSKSSIRSRKNDFRTNLLSVIRKKLSERKIFLPRLARATDCVRLYNRTIFIDGLSSSS